MPRAAQGLAVAMACGAALLSGCVGPDGFRPVTVEAAPDAANPECARVMVSLPRQLGGFGQRETTSQASSAWGDPSAVVLRCGVEPPAPSTDPCATVNGVDWLVSEPTDGATAWKFTTYGRVPATEVVLDNTRAPSSTVLVELASVMEQVPQEAGRCLSTTELDQ